ncbi:hypothetical protein Tco_0658463 [Tanacetum coccineum]
MVSCDGLGGYDWSNQAKEGPNYALMAYSSSSSDLEVIPNKAFRVFNSRTRIVKENLHIRFSENTPNAEGSGPDWLFDIDALRRTMNYEPIVAGTQSNSFTADPPFSQDPKSSHDDGSNPSSDDGKKVDEDLRKDSECNDQEKEDNVNIINNFNATSTNKVNVVGGKTSIELLFDPDMPALYDYSIFDFIRDDEDDGVVADMNNLDTTIKVSPNPTTRIHKDHPLDQVIGDLQSAKQTRQMSKNLEEHGNNPKRPNGDALRKCILECPYTPFTVIILVVPATDKSPAVPEQTTVETILNMSPENKAHFESEKEAIHLILTGIGDEIYSTVDACKTAHEMWEAIERFVTIVKQQHKLDEVSYHKLFDILKQYQKEVNEIRAEQISKNDNPFTLVATAQPYQDLYYQSAAEEDSDAEQAQKDKEMQKNLALIAKYFKKIYKPTNNNLITSSNTKNKNMDITPRYKNNNQTGQFGNQRTMTIVGARETEYRKPKRVKDSTYHKEKMLLCKQAEKDVPLQAEKSDWLADTDEEIDEQELEAHYSYMAKIQEHSEQSESISNTCVVETGDSNVIPDSPDMYDNDIQNDQNVVECDDERVALANLIANLKLYVNKNKKIQKQLKKANTTLAHELNECKSILAETSRTLGESNSIQDSCLVAL